ncbi:MAG: hypothetical protein EBS55_14995, partial [Flavobacteriaceae bacterium]|nr:hypothetical protein [Flavobacteriaceae bacterium]
GGNEVVKFIEKELGQSSDDIIKLLERSTISDAALVSKSFEELLTKSTISNVERKFVSDVLRTMFGSVITKRYSDYMNDLSVEARKKIQGLLLDDTKTLEKKAEKLRKYYDSNANEITAQIFVDEAKKTKPNIVPPKPPKPSGGISDDELLNRLMNSGDESIAPIGELYLEGVILKLESEGKITPLGKLEVKDVASKVSKGIEKMGAKDLEQIQRVFDKLPPDEQWIRINKAIEALQKALESKGKSEASKKVGDFGKTLDKSKPGLWFGRLKKLYLWSIMIVGGYELFTIFRDLKNRDLPDDMGSYLTDKIIYTASGFFAPIVALFTNGSSDNDDDGGEEDDQL